MSKYSYNNNPLFDDTRSVEDRVKEIIKTSEVLQDMQALHNIPIADIEKAMTEIVKQTDDFKFYFKKYDTFLFDKFPHWC